MANEGFEEDEDGVLILDSQYTGEFARPAAPAGPPQHERAVPLALRVRGGTIASEGLTLEGNFVPWDTVQFLALGQVHHSLGSMDPPKTMVRQVFSKLTNKDSGSGSSRKNTQYQESMLIDIYAAPSMPPYRLDSVNLNYKSFLGQDIAMISAHNFFRLAVRLARGATAARVSTSYAALLKRRRDQIRPYGAIYDFELDCQNSLNALESLPRTVDLDLTRDNYVEEGAGNE
jgi:hypothetical protein